MLKTALHLFEISVILIVFYLVEKLNATNFEKHRNASFKFKAGCLYEKKTALMIEKVHVLPYKRNKFNITVLLRRDLSGKARWCCKEELIQPYRYKYIVFTVLIATTNPLHKFLYSLRQSSIVNLN